MPEINKEEINKEEINKVDEINKEDADEWHQFKPLSACVSVIVARPLSVCPPDFAGASVVGISGRPFSISSSLFDLFYLFCFAI